MYYYETNIYCIRWWNKRTLITYINYSQVDNCIRWYI